jgi:hypothetical protein
MLQQYPIINLNFKSWIFCEKQIQEMMNLHSKNWQERLFFERLERKSKPIFYLLEQTTIGKQCCFVFWRRIFD